MESPNRKNCSYMAGCRKEVSDLSDCTRKKISRSPYRLSIRYDADLWASSKVSQVCAGLGTVRYSTCLSLSLLDICAMQCRKSASINTFDGTMETDKLQTNRTTVCLPGSFPPESSTANEVS